MTERPDNISDDVDDLLDETEADDHRAVVGRSAQIRVGTGMVVVLMAVAFAAGFAARGSFGSDPLPSTVPATDVAPNAPALDPNQLQGGLPSGHPPVSGQTGVPATPSGTPSARTTPSP